MNPTKNNTTDSIILISKKAYNDFAGRIHDIFIDRLNAPSIADEALEAFDHYVRGEEISIHQMDKIVQIAFLMIKPDIDKAIARSKAARLRAAARKIAKTEALSAADTESPTHIAENPIISNQAADENTTHKKCVTHPKIRTNCRQTKKMTNIIKKKWRKGNRIAIKSKNQLRK